MKAPSQDLFRTVYRGRQGALRHISYMRMSKVLLLQRVFGEMAISLVGKDIFDYGFGAGTFFRYCPKESRLRGVELDSVAVGEVTENLRRRGFLNIDLEAINMAAWHQHRLLQQAYDVVICSHVLEHLENPSNFLGTMSRCVRPRGVFVGLVPINERVMETHHVQRIDRTLVQKWATAAGLRLVRWTEGDPWLYWVQPLFTCETGWRHRAAQAISIMLGPLAAGFGWRAWHSMSDIFQRVSASHSTQAAFVLSHDEKNDVVESCDSSVDST